MIGFCSTYISTVLRYFYLIALPTCTVRFNSFFAILVYISSFRFPLYPATLLSTPFTHLNGQTKSINIWSRNIGVTSMFDIKERLSPFSLRLVMQNQHFGACVVFLRTFTFLVDIHKLSSTDQELILLLRLFCHSFSIIWLFSFVFLFVNCASLS